MASLFPRCHPWALISGDERRVWCSGSVQSCSPPFERRPCRKNPDLARPATWKRQKKWPGADSVSCFVGSRSGCAGIWSKFEPAKLTCSENGPHAETRVQKLKPRVQKLDGFRNYGSAMGFEQLFWAAMDLWWDHCFCLDRFQHEPSLWSVALRVARPVLLSLSLSRGRPEQRGRLTAGRYGAIR